MRQRRFDDAALVIRRFNDSEVFLPGVGLSADGLEAVLRETLQHLFADGLPRIIGRVTPEVGELLMLAGAMSLLGAGKAHQKYLPPGFRSGSHLSDEVAVRMVTFAAMHRRRMDQYREMGVSHVRIAATSDACDACAALRGKRFPLSDAPEFPYPKCTCEAGCRCRPLAVLEEYDAGAE